MRCQYSMGLELGLGLCTIKYIVIPWFLNSLSASWLVCKLSSPRVDWPRVGLSANCPVSYCATLLAEHVWSLGHLHGTLYQIVSVIQYTQFWWFCETYWIRIMCKLLIILRAVEMLYDSVVRDSTIDIDIFVTNLLLLCLRCHAALCLL